MILAWASPFNTGIYVLPIFHKRISQIDYALWVVNIHLPLKI